jgi:hypothetical protein
MPQKTWHFIAGTYPSAEQNRSYRMECHLKFSHDAKVASSSSQSPKQIRVLAGVSADYRSIRNNHGKSPHIVTGQAVQAIEPSGSASKNQATGAGVGNDTGRKSQSHRLRCTVNGTKQASTLESRMPCLREDFDLAHWREVNDQAVIA